MTDIASVSFIRQQVSDHPAFTVKFTPPVVNDTTTTVEGALQAGANLYSLTAQEIVRGGKTTATIDVVLGAHNRAEGNFVQSPNGVGLTDFATPATPTEPSKSFAAWLRQADAPVAPTYEVVPVRHAKTDRATHLRALAIMHPGRIIQY